MLDFILDFFIKYLMKGIINEGNGNSPVPKIMGSPESHTPMHDEDSCNDILIRKKSMIEVMSDLMQLLSSDSNIRLFDDLRFIDTLNQLINFMYLHQGTSQIPLVVERELRICIEIYMSKL